MRYLLFIFGLLGFLQAQMLYTDTFPNFFASTLDSTVAMYKMYSSPTTDLSTYGNTNTLTAGGSAGDSVTAIAVLQQDSSVVYLNSATPQYFNILAASAGDMNHGTNDFTWEILFHSGNINQHGYLLSKVLTSGAFAGSHVRITNSTANGVGKRVVVQVRKDGSNTRLLVTTSDIVDGNPHHLALVRSSTTTIKLYVDGAEATLNTLTSAGSDLNMDASSNFSIGIWSNLSTNPFIGHVEYARITRSALTQKEIKEAAFLPQNWACVGSDVPGITRANYGFHFGLTGADTVYVDSLLTAGNWSISIQDSAASGVGYTILTSSDKSTWTTLSSGTTGTSWGTKAYTGTGSGYIGIAVASGSAYFDNLTVSLAAVSGKFKAHSGYNKFKGF
jgi:hypothetical protein